MFARFAAALTLAGFVIPDAGAAASEPVAGTEAPEQAGWTQACEDWDEWDKAGPPFRIHANSYYVGTCGIAAILITDGPGHILIDGGTEAGAEVIAANIEKLGFKLTDIKMLLMSHEHFDHVGGLARLQQISGASLVTSPKAAPVMESGEASDEDPQAGMHDPFSPAKVRGFVEDGDYVQIGKSKLTAVSTPGHTPGALSWQWESCDEGGMCKTIVYADSLSPISNDTYRFSDYPEYVAAYRAGIDRLAKLDCDILLTPHPSASGMREKLVAGDLTGGPTCRDYAQDIGERLDERLSGEIGK